MCIAEIIAEFSLERFFVSEDDAAPAVMVCVDIVSGTVGSGGLNITIINDGGSATGESCDDKHTVHRQRDCMKLTHTQFIVLE